MIKSLEPLSDDETLELLKRAQSGDLEAEEELIKHNINLVSYIVNLKFRDNQDDEELISEGRVGLVKAIKNFDFSRKIKFSTFAGTCITNQILNFLKQIKKQQHVDSLERPIFQGDNDGTLQDIISDDTDIVEEHNNNEMYRAIDEFITSLPAKYQRVVILRFGFYNNRIYKLREIADMLSVSRTWVSKLLRRILDDLKYYLKENGYIDGEIALPNINQDNQRVFSIEEIELLKTLDFTELADLLLPDEMRIVSSSLGFITADSLSVDEVANFLDVSPQEVIYAIKKALLLYKDSINQSPPAKPNGVVKKKEIKVI